MIVFSASGASQQACYARTGELLTFQRGGGTVDRSGVTSSLITRPFSLICMSQKYSTLYDWTNV